MVKYIYTVYLYGSYSVSYKLALVLKFHKDFYRDEIRIDSGGRFKEKNHFLSQAKCL